VSRLLPAHVLALAAVAGLAFANVLRLEPPLLALGLAGAALLMLLGAPADGRLALCAVVVAALGWGWASARLDTLDRSWLSPLVGRGGHALVEVTAEARPGRFAQRIPARVLRWEGNVVPRERAELELPLGRSPPQGALIDALVVVRQPHGPANGFDERTWLRRQGIHVVLKVDAWTQVGRRGGLGGAGDRLRRWLARGSAPGVAGERRAVLEGILLGDDAQLSDNLKTSFQRSGLYHLLAVSGQNVVLLAAGVLGLALLLGAPRWCGHVGSLVAILGYTLAVGPQPSVIRAAVSGGAVSVAWLLGRERDAWHVLLLAAIVLLAWNPYALFDAGFQLSFAAVVAIFVLAPRLKQWLAGYPGSPSLHTAVSISVACSVATAPLLWLQFGRVPMLGVVANALAEVAIAPLLALAFIAALVDPFAPPLAEALAYLNGWLAEYVAWCARIVGSVSFAQLTGRTAAAAAGVMLLGAAYAWRRWQQTTSSPPI